MNTLEDFPHLYSRDFKLDKPLTDEELQDVCIATKKRMTELTSVSPRVSVVFPAYNEEMYLPLMLWTLSKLATDIPIEIIGVNNASTDRTGEIIQQSGIQRVDEHKKGVSYARQAGLEVAKGDIVATTDADTQVPETWINASLSYFKQNPKLVCFSGGSDPNGGHISYWMIRSCIRFLRKSLNKDVSSNWSFPGHNMLFKKEAASNVGGYEPGIDLGEDNLLARKLMKHGDILRIDDLPTGVITSARRVATFGKVINIVVSRLRDHIDILDYNNLGNYRGTFSDIR